MKILVLVNPDAGNGKTLRQKSWMEKRLEKNPHEFVWKVSESPDALRHEILGAPVSGNDGILLMGGDGTVHAALPALSKIDLPFGLLPCGRGNDFARNIGIPLNLKKNCFLPSLPHFQEVDLAFINRRPFGSIACTGFDAQVNKFARDKKGFFGGTLGYIICVLLVLREFQPFAVDVKVDDFRWSGKIMMAAIANGPFYGGGMKIAPDASINNGRFDVCIIQEVSKWKLLREFPKVFKGTHVSHPKVILKTGSSVEVLSDEQREIFADGEYVGDTPCLASISKRTIRVMRTDRD